MNYLRCIKILTYLTVLTFIGLGIYLIDEYQKDKDYIKALSHNNCHVSGPEIHTHLDTRYRSYVLTANISYLDGEEYQTRIYLDQSGNLEKMERSKEIYQDTHSECFTNGDKVFLDKPSPDSTLIFWGIWLLVLFLIILFMIIKLDIREYQHRNYDNIA
jgi:hypothetical protein